MCVPDLTLYPSLLQLLQVFFGHLHSSSLESVAQLVWALLACQSLHSADLARALPDLETSHARQAFRRVGRIIQRAPLTGERLTPLLIRAALQLVNDKELFLILDSTRCRNWEIFTLGILFHGRVLPVAWSVLPYPWPKKSFTPTVVALVDRTLNCWPPDRPVHLLADRGFPSLKLFRKLDSWRRRLPLGYTLRLRAADYVKLDDGQIVKVASLVGLMALGTWACWQASYQRRGKAGPSVSLVVGRGVPVYPPHQKGLYDQARRAERGQRRKAYLLRKGQPQAPSTDTAWALLSTTDGRQQAVANYRRRFSTEGTYRDVKSWDLEAVAAHETDKAHLDGLIGLATLGYLVQAAIGAAAGRASDEQARARQRQWSTTDRLSVFWRGRQVLHDRAHDWHTWLNRLLPELAGQLGSRANVVEQSGKPFGTILCKEAA